MSKRFLVFLLASATALGGIAGCCTPGPRSGYFAARTPAPGPCGPCGAGVVSPPGRIIPIGAPMPPGPAAALPPGPLQPGAFTQPAPGTGGTLPPDPGVRLAAPEPADAAIPGPPPAPDTNRVERPAQPQLLPPETPEPPKAPPAPPPAPPREERDATPPLPVDIPQFAMARPRVASGQQPFPDGLAWLRAHGYKTVLYVRPPGSDDAAARRQFDKYGLRYLSLEVSPQTLSKQVVEQFNRTVTDENNLPLFVYDKDGSLAGGLWYLYYRTVEKLDDERARTEAARLGFQQDQDGAHRTMWLAVQNYLATQKP